MTQSKWMILLALSAGSTMVAHAAPTAAKEGGKVLLAAKGDKKAGKGNRGQIAARNSSHRRCWKRFWVSH